MARKDEIAVSRRAYPATQEERLTLQFYDWEQPCRGWQVFPYPVQLEPPFRPFLFHYAPTPLPVDDGRRPTFLSSVVERILGRSSSAAQNYHWLNAVPPEEPEPEIFEDATPLTEIHIALPPSVKITPQIAEQFLLGLRFCLAPVGFEMIGLADSITLQVACRENDSYQLQQQLRAYCPEAALRESPDFLKEEWQENKAGAAVIVDFGLSHEFMRPLHAFSSFEVDPLIGITGALSNLHKGEIALLQVLFQAAQAPWAESIMRAVTDEKGNAFFADAPEMVPLAKQKIARPLYAAVIRVAARSASERRAWHIVKNIAGTLTQFSNPPSNEFIPLTNDDYSDKDHETDLLLRRSRRSGMILNSTELISLVHLPSLSVRSEKLTREVQKTKAAPALAAGGRLILGENTHSGGTRTVTVRPEHRTRHTYVIGASGTGKSTLLLNLIIQDMQNGEGIGVLDPHGDLIDHILEYVPPERFSDVVLFDPSDTEYPVGFNILSAHSELEKNLLSSDLVSVFRRLSTSWGDQMTSVLGNAILAFLESEHGGTFSDLRRFLIEEPFRRSFLATVKDSEVVYYWQKEYPLLAGKPQAPLLTRLDTFLRPKLIRYMVSQKENRINFGTLMNEGKIFLAKLAQGAIGEENSYLLGSLLVSKFHQLAISRQEIEEAKRRNFYLYIDEFHNFITPSMAAILSGARKYHLGLILAHQELRQLASRDAEVASAVITNPYTRICFQLGDADAKMLEKGFSFFDASDLQNLGVGEAVCRIERAEYDFNLKTFPLPKVEPEAARERREQIIALSREKYATRREEVEAELRVAIATPPPVAPARQERKSTREESRESPPVQPPIETKRKAKEKEAPKIAPAPAPLGRGGGQHKYLQQLIKRMGEAKGYRATIEKQILGGLGSVDVALEKDTRAIACEISVTSTVEYELDNIQKCLAAGFEQVILVSSESKTLSKAKEKASASLKAEDFARVQFLTPEELVSSIEELDAQANSGQENIRGYKVNVNFRAVPENEKKARKQAIGQTILQALKRMKGPK